MKKILIADDSMTSRMIVKRCLEMAGLRDSVFLECKDGAEALVVRQGTHLRQPQELRADVVDHLDVLRVAAVNVHVGQHHHRGLEHVGADSAGLGGVAGRVDVDVAVGLVAAAIREAGRSCPGRPLRAHRGGETSPLSPAAAKNR